MQQLLAEYKKALKDTRKLKREAPEEDQKVIAGMISSLEFCVKWIETGRMPGSKRGVEKHSAYTYFDQDVWDYVAMNDHREYSPFDEIEEKIDKEIEVKSLGNGPRTSTNNKRTNERRTIRHRSLKYFNRDYAN